MLVIKAAKKYSFQHNIRHKINALASPGKTIGKIKSRIEEAILDGKIENSYEEAIEYLSKIKSQFTQNQSRLK